MATERARQPQAQQAPQDWRTQRAEEARILERGPRGIGMAVAFDWAIAAQFLILAPFIALGVGAGQMAANMLSLFQVETVAAAVIVAGLCALFGEYLRRGNRYVWAAQIALNTLLFFGGFYRLGDSFAALTQHGHVSGLVRSALLLIISPMIVFLLTRPQTRAWIKVVTKRKAMARHGGRWIFVVALWAMLGGALIAFYGFY